MCSTSTATFTVAVVAYVQKEKQPYKGSTHEVVHNGLPGLRVSRGGRFRRLRHGRPEHRPPLLSGGAVVLDQQLARPSRHLFAQPNRKTGRQNHEGKVMINRCTRAFLAWKMGGEKTGGMRAACPCYSIHRNWHWTLLTLIILYQKPGLVLLHTKYVVYTRDQSTTHSLQK